MNQYLPFSNMVIINIMMKNLILTIAALGLWSGVYAQEW